MVDLPAPLGPRIAQKVPALISKETPFRTFSRSWRRVMFSRTILSRSGGSATASRRSVTSAGVSRISKMRLRETRAAARFADHAHHGLNGREQSHVIGHEGDQRADGHGAVDDHFSAVEED